MGVAGLSPGVGATEAPETTTAGEEVQSQAGLKGGCATLLFRVGLGEGVPQMAWQKLTGW